MNEPLSNLSHLNASHSNPRLESEAAVRISATFEGSDGATQTILPQTAEVDEQEEVILRLAAGRLNREEFVDWVRLHLQQGSAEPAPGTSPVSDPATPQN